MPKTILFTIALISLASTAGAHQIWLERGAGEVVRVYLGEAEIAPDRGEHVAGLAATTQVFTTDRTQASRLEAKDDHVEARVTGAGDVRLINDQAFKPWKTEEGLMKAAVFTAREGRTETRAMLDYEFVPASADGNVFTLQFKGQPLAGKEVTVIDPEKWTKRLVTDANGRVDVPLKGIGRYILFADHSVDESRKVAGQAVAQVGYTTTLSFVTR